MSDGMTEFMVTKITQMYNQISSITKLKLEVSASSGDAVKWNMLKGTLRVPRGGYYFSPTSSSLTYTDVLVEEDDVLMTEEFLAKSKEDGTVVKSRTRHTVILKASGLPLHEQEDCSVVGTWLDEINHVKDMVKNPFNTHFHQYLDQTEQPYKGEELFITADQDVYMKVQGYSWVPIAGKMAWVESHLSSLPKSFAGEVQRYILAQRLTK